jgi:23S rRNA pseudouridine2605 synthase
MEKLRVQKILSNAGVCSRRRAEELIAAGKVRVNGKIITLGDQAGREDKITIDHEELKQERRIYLMFHKPVGCVTALHDDRYKTVMSYIKIKERVFPVGRLDFNTSGLLLLTNDGDFANEIMHPSKNIKKTYLVKLNKPIDKKSIKLLQRGILLEDGKTSPAKLKSLDRRMLEITIHEGRNRIIRRMFNSLNYNVTQLHRISIGHLKLDNLKVTRYRKLNRKDMKKIFD